MSSQIDYIACFGLDDGNSKELLRRKGDCFFFITFSSLHDFLSAADANKHAFKAILVQASAGEELGMKFKNKLWELGYHHIPFLLITEKIDHQQAKILQREGIAEVFLNPLRVDVVVRKLKIILESRRQVEVTPSSEDKIRIGKRIFDIVGASLALLIFSPVFLLVALLIKLHSKGPIFYYSLRVGTGYKIFRFYKFRSMIVDADKKLSHLKHLNLYNEDKNEATFVKIRDDPRITPIGRFIRNTSIDELPQLWNVLKGDMSLVGNRPLPLYEAEKLTTDKFALRFMAPAGITGLWQVSKRGSCKMSDEERIGLDNDYAKSYNLFFDVRLLLRTVPALLQKVNA